MKRLYCKGISAMALMLAMLLALTGCSLEDLDAFSFGFHPTETAGTKQEVPPVAQVPPQPVATEATVPEETVPPATVPERTYYWVRADGGLNIRKGPGQEYEIVGRLDDGTQICPQKWENGWAYLTSPCVGWCSGDYLFDVSQVQIANNAILGRWCSGSGEYTNDGRFVVCFNDYWTFHADGTFNRTDTESVFYYNLDGTQNDVLGAGALDSKGTFSFDGSYLTVVTTHRCESSSGPYIKLVTPEVAYAKITFDGDTLLVDWGSRIERFYRESGDALARRLMREQR